MLNNDDIQIITKIVNDSISKAVAPLATKAEVAQLATKAELTAEVSKLATKADFDKSDTKLTKLDVKMTSQFADLKAKTTKDTLILEKAIKREHKIGGEILEVAQTENIKLERRVERIERHLHFVPLQTL